MATDPLQLVEQELIDSPLETPEQLRTFIVRELRPILRQVRTILNRRVRYTHIPVFDVAPITDAVLDPYGRDPPEDGTVARSGTDGSIYQRVDGVWVAIT